MGRHSSLDSAESAAENKARRQLTWSLFTVVSIFPVIAVLITQLVSADRRPHGTALVAAIVVTAVLVGVLIGCIRWVLRSARVARSQLVPVDRKRARVAWKAALQGVIEPANATIVRTRLRAELRSLSPRMFAMYDFIIVVEIFNSVVSHGVLRWMHGSFALMWTGIALSRVVRRPGAERARAALDALAGS